MVLATSWVVSANFWVVSVRSLFSKCAKFVPFLNVNLFVKNRCILLEFLLVKESWNMID